VCKKSITNSQPFVKKMKMSGPSGGGGVDSHCRHDQSTQRYKLLLYE